METFPIVKRKDEQKYGEYRTKLVILECYDAMAESMKTGRPYQIILDPPQLTHTRRPFTKGAVGLPFKGSENGEKWTSRDHKASRFNPLI